jgi:hypothetical protein
MTPQNTPVTIEVTNNDIDGNLDPTTVTIQSGPDNGSTSADGAGNVTYTPNASFSGDDTFTYQVCDTFGACDTASVTITVTTP